VPTTTTPQDEHADRDRTGADDTRTDAVAASTTTRRSTPDEPTAPQIGGQPTAEATDVPPTVTVRAWWDPGLTGTGHDPRGEYAERFWLGIVGPSTLLLLRRFARGLEQHPGGFRVGLADTARALGLGSGTGRNSPVVRTIDRARTFGLARTLDTGDLAVRTLLPPLSRRHVARLPESLRRSHDAWLDAERRRPG